MYLTGVVVTEGRDQVRLESGDLLVFGGAQGRHIFHGA